MRSERDRHPTRVGIWFNINDAQNKISVANRKPRDDMIKRVANLFANLTILAMRLGRLTFGRVSIETRISIIIMQPGAEIAQPVISGLSHWIWISYVRGMAEHANAL